jgi:hypothetical protein
MKSLTLIVAALVLAAPAAAQRRFRFGPVASIIALDEGTTTASFTSFGGTLALLSSQEAETGLTIARYADLSTTACERSLTFFGLTSYYYPVGATGFAPFASTEMGLARVRDEDPGLLSACTTAEASNQIGLAFGLGVRVNVGTEIAGLVEGRFFQVLPQGISAIQALEARANLSVTFGKPRGGELVGGTVGPAVSAWIPVGGVMRARGPLLGVRFRRDTRRAGSVGLQVDYVPLRLTDGCTQDCNPYAVFFAPGYEAALHPPWGRFYGTVGALIAGFPAEGPDRGMAHGAQGGLGADLFAGTGLIVNLSTRLLWLQRSGGQNVFAVQLGASLSARLVHPKAS